MAKGKTFALRIQIQTIDRATAGIRRVVGVVRQAARAVQQLGRRLSRLGRQAGLGRLAAGFQGVGRAAKGVALRIGAIAVAAGLGARAITGMFSKFDTLAKTADRLGLTVDAFAQLRFAAGQAGVGTDKFASAMDGFSKRIGEAKAGTGSLVTLLNKVSPTLLKQIQAAKGNEEAFGLMADAMVKLKDPTKRAALATAAFGRSGAPLILLLKNGRKGIDALKQEYFDLAGSQEDSARKSEAVTDAFGRVDASMDGVRASIVSGLAPAFLILSKMASDFFKRNRKQIAAWAKDFGEKLPGRIAALIKAIKSIGRSLKPVWDLVGGFSGAVKILAGLLVGKLAFAFVVLGRAMLATPFGLFMVGVAGLISIWKQLSANWALVADGFRMISDGMAAAFGRFLSRIKSGFLTFTPLGWIIRAWSPVLNFFKGLWGGIVGVFEGALATIMGIVDSVVGAVKQVVNAVRDAKNAVIGGDVTETVAGLRAAHLRGQAPGGSFLAAAAGGFAGGQQPGGKSEVEVSFVNAPAGMRVNEARQGAAVLNTNVGYQLGTP